MGIGSLVHIALKQFQKVQKVTFWHFLHFWDFMSRNCLHADHDNLPENQKSQKSLILNFSNWLSEFLWSQFWRNYDHIKWSKSDQFIDRFMVMFLVINDLSLVCSEQVCCTWDRKGQNRQVDWRRLVIGRLSEDDRNCKVFESFLAVFSLKNEPVFEQVLRTKRHPPSCEVYWTGDPVGEGR